MANDSGRSAADFSRRTLIGLSTATGLAWGSGLRGEAAAARAASPQPVRMDVDGLGLTPTEFAALLQRLSAAIVPDEYSLGGEVAQLEEIGGHLEPPVEFLDFPFQVPKPGGGALEALGGADDAHVVPH